MNIPEFRTVDLKMSSFQSEYYLKAYAEDSNERKSIYNSSRQASLFVFPDGTWGSQGVKTYINEKKDKYILNDELREEVRNIKKLRRLSIKYAEVIDTIRKNPKKNIYIYCSIVNGSGAKLLAKILELYGFESCRGTEPMPASRYILLTGDTINIDGLINYYNNDRNVEGEYCQVIIGSKKISEGFSFFNIQIEILLTFHWNYTETSQALRRALRYGSHKSLKALKGNNIKVHIKQFAAIPIEGAEMLNQESIDLRMLAFSVRKDISIKRMERICQESAFDCPLNYERNVGSLEGSRECNYQKCDYKCDTALNPIRRTESDYSSYEAYYGNYMSLVPKILKLFQMEYSHTYEYLKDVLDVSDIQLLKCLAYIIETNVVLYNSYGYPCYLRERDNTYYLTGSKFTSYDGLQIQSKYIRKPFFSKKISLSEIIEENSIKVGKKVLEQFLISAPSDYSQFEDYFKQLPSVIAERFILKAAEMIVEKRRTRITDFVLNLYGNSIYFPPRGDYKAVYEAPNRTICLKGKEWVECKVQKISSPTREESHQKPPKDAKYIGIVEGDKFCIQDLSKLGASDKRKRTTGSVCTEAGWKKDKLINLASEIGLSVNASLTKAEICEKIKENLASKNLIRKGKCGTARKKKI